MKRTLFLIGLFWTIVPAIAQSSQQNKINSVSIDVALDSLGGADITEIWDVEINLLSNTEWYLAKNNLGPGKVSGLQVCDTLTGEVFRQEYAWDTGGSREQKKGRCGIVDRSYVQSYELCWGVGENGPHVWKVQYHYDNLVTAFSDSCAFNHMFLSDGFDPAPDTASVIIRYPGKPLTDDVASVWAFRFEGEIGYRPLDGTIYAHTYKSLTPEDGIVVLAAFDSSLFRPAVKIDDSFGTLKEKAFEGSNYFKDYSSEPERPWWEKVLTTILIIVVILFAIILYYAGPMLLVIGAGYLFGTIIPFIWGIISLYPLRMYIRRKKCFKNGAQWYRKVPDANTLKDVPYIMSHYSYNILSEPEGWDNQLTAAYIMKLFFEGGLSLYKETDKHGKLRSYLNVTKDWKGPSDRCSENDRQAMFHLYGILKCASGRDLILQDGELKRWKKDSGESSIKAFYKLRDRSNMKCDQEEACQTLGLYNYLKDFSALSERGVQDVILWNDYLVYATAFGIGDKVMKQMKEIAPEYFELSKVNEFLGTDGNILYNINSLYNLSSNVSSSYVGSSSSGSSSGGIWNSYGGHSSSYSGGGGHSSYHGGGGHTGGGGGGGR